MSEPDKDKSAKGGNGLVVALLLLTLAAIGGATFYVETRLATLDEHIQAARIAAEEAESAAGAAAQNSANAREAKLTPSAPPVMTCADGSPAKDGPSGLICPAAAAAP